MVAKVKGSFFQKFGNLVIDTANAAKASAADQITAELEKAIREELDGFFPLLFETVDKQRFDFNNDWTKGYRSVPTLSMDYQVRKEVHFGANGPDYFKGKHGLSPRHKIKYRKGARKGQEKYPYKRSLHFKLSQLAKGNHGQVLLSKLGGIGVGFKTESGVDSSKGAIVNGKPKKYGQRGGLINARWQDIVSDEYVKIAKRRGNTFSLKEGYYRADNHSKTHKIQRPDGRLISLERAIAEGVLKINITGRFFKNLREDNQGFLNFLIDRTQFLKIPRGFAHRSLDSRDSRLEEILKMMARENRLIIDPVFGEILKRIYKRLEKIKKEVSSRG